MELAQSFPQSMSRVGCTRIRRCIRLAPRLLVLPNLEWWSWDTNHILRGRVALCRSHELDHQPRLAFHRLEFGRAARPCRLRLSAGAREPELRNDPRVRVGVERSIRGEQLVPVPDVPRRVPERVVRTSPVRVL